MARGAVGVVVLAAVLLAGGGYGYGRCGLDDKKTKCGGDKKEHKHRACDMRLALAEIAEINDCGFRYIDLENNSTGPNTSLSYAKGFYFGEAEFLGGDPEKDLMTSRQMKDFHTGLRGLLVYCSVCHFAMGFRQDLSRK